MRIISATVIGTLGYVSWQLGLIQAVTGVGDAALKEPVTIEERISSGLVITRQVQNLTPLKPDRELEEWLLTSGNSEATEPEAMAQAIRRAWPQYQEVRVLRAYSLSDDNIVERASAWPALAMG